MEYENDPRYSSNWTSPPYPSQYGYDRINMPQPQMMPPTSSPSSQNLDLHQHQYQDWNNNNNNAWNQQPHSGRINEAVNSAFGETDRSSYLSPEVVSQITANVIQQLKTTGLDNIQSQQPQQHPQWAPVPGAGNGYPQSPTSPHTGPEGTFNYQHYPHPIYQGSPHPSRPSPVSQSMERHGSRASQSSEHNPKPETRPSPLSNESSDTGMTTLEKIWGKLFEDGKPTKRLGQFLRGIAMHLIEDYPPGNTLVVTPEKMQKFYEDTGIPTDPYPWEDIFDDRTSAISRLLRDVEAEHHLVQMRLDERPDIPGLTPRGFERWATLMLQTHPDKEFERLQKTVLNMPISNPDDKKERFPKEIPRSLFPEKPDLELRRDIDQSMIKHCAVDLPPVTDEDIAAMHRAKSYVSPTVEDGDDEEDRGYEEDEDEEEAKTPGPIERERKPYSAQPGGGKTYDEAGPSKPGHTKSFSTSSRQRENSIPSAPGHRDDLHNQDPYYARTGSAGSHPATVPTSRTGRSRSSSRGMHPGGDYRHSEGDLLGHNGAPRYAAASDYYLNPPSNMPEIGEESRRHRDFEEDKRLYESYRERERAHEKSKYHDYLPPRGTWTGEEDYYRGVGGGPVGGGSDRYNPYYGYR